MNVRGTFNNKAERKFDGRIPSICYGTERKVRSALKPYEGEDFLVDADHAKVIPGLRRQRIVKLHRVYSNNATFEICVGAGTMFGTPTILYYSVPLFEVGKGYRPRHEKPGCPWLRYDGDKYVEEE